MVQPCYYQNVLYATVKIQDLQEIRKPKEYLLKSSFWP